MENKKWVIQKKTFRSVLFISIVLIVLGYIILGSRSHVHNNAGVTLSFSVNIVFFFVMLIASISKYTYSFDMMFWLFSLFFFGFSPMLQYYTGIYS